MADQRRTSQLSKPDMERSDSSGASSVNNGPTRMGPDASRVDEEYLDDEEDMTPMSPRRTSDDIEALGREAREEMRR